MSLDMYLSEPIGQKTEPALITVKVRDALQCYMRVPSSTIKGSCSCVGSFYGNAVNWRLEAINPVFLCKVTYGIIEGNKPSTEEWRLLGCYAAWL
jgi:hypothetical protein